MGPIVVSRIRAFEVPIADDVNGKLYSVEDVPALAKAIKAARSQRETLGTAATTSVKNNFNSSHLDTQLTQSIRPHPGFKTAIETDDLRPSERAVPATNF